MKSDFFSPEILESYMRNLKQAKTPEEQLKKSQYIIDWLDWLREKSLISNTEYERSVNEVKKLVKNTTAKSTNIGNAAYLYSRYIYVVVIIFLLFIIGYIYKTRFVQQGNIQSRNNAYYGRTLPYKGKLLDDAGLPITTKTDITFRIYTSPAVGDPVYTGACKGQNGIEPDYNGNFTVVLGSDCGMPQIDESIFQTQKEIYLGVQLGSGSELTPRQKITTSGYSSDAARLQGLPLGAEKESIPFINKQGRVIFKHTDPYLQTISGTFTIESPNVTIKTTDENHGSILFQPSSQGNTIIGNGKFGIGTQTPVSSLTVETLEPFGNVGTLKNNASEDNEALSVLNLHVGTLRTGVESTFMNFFAETTQTDSGEHVGSIRLNNGGVAYETSGADFAEYFDTNESNIPAGYIMSLTATGVNKSKKGEVVVGVTSDRAGFVGNKKNTNTNSSLIALTGQVEVFITNVRGEIMKGDAIVTSDIPGYGEKGSETADVVGYALENSNSTQHLTCPAEITQTYGNDITCYKMVILLK